VAADKTPTKAIQKDIDSDKGQKRSVRNRSGESGDEQNQASRTSPVSRPKKAMQRPVTTIWKPNAQPCCSTAVAHHKQDSGSDEDAAALAFRQDESVLQHYWHGTEGIGLMKA